MKPIIDVQHVSKEYRIGQVRKRESLREMLASKMQFWRRKGREAEGKFLALDDVSFSVGEGEVVGIMGRNGAGKSTLLKVLARITPPTKGTVHLRGRMASLLEVGTGFHPELTGRENIFLNGAILGLRRKEIIARFDEIVAFAEVAQFLETPVKHFSSGMYVRLAFAVAAHLDPEILVVDEVLAVGDMAFQKRCLGKMNEVSRSGRTVLFVSHNMATIENLCQRGIVLEKGRVVLDASVKDAVQHYLNTAAGNPGVSGDTVIFGDGPNRKMTGGKLLQKAELFTDGDVPLTQGLQIGAPLKLKIYFTLPRPTDSFNIGLRFSNLFGQAIFTAHSWYEPDRSHGKVSGPQVFICDIPSLTLVAGDYSIFLWIDLANSKADMIEDAIRISVIDSDYYGTGKVPRNGTFVLPHRWRLEPAMDTATEPAQETTPVL